MANPMIAAFTNYEWIPLVAMHTTAPQRAAKPDTETHLDPRLNHLNDVIEHVAHLLPAQGPITVFIHHNTLHAFEDAPFHEAVKRSASLFGCQPYLTEDRYREELKRGRIRFDKLKTVLIRDLGERGDEELPIFGTRLDLRLAMLQYPLRTGPTPELIWFVAEANALRRVRAEASFAVRSQLIAETRRWVVRDLRGAREPGPGAAKSTGTDALLELLERFGGSRIESWTDDEWEGFTLQALWRVCCDGVRGLPPFTAPPPPAIRPRDLLFEATGADSDALVHGMLIPFCAAFLDQGVARWELPRRELGFLRAFAALYGRSGGSPERWRRGLAEALVRLEKEGISPLESIRESLDVLGVSRDEWEPFLAGTLLALRGWAGMIHQIESRGDRVVRPIRKGSLVEFLAVRLILERLALAYIARTGLGIDEPVREFWHLLRGQIDPHWPPSVEQRAFLVFQLAQVFGTTPGSLHALGCAEWSKLLQEIEEFSALERRRLFHEAYEQRLYTQSLDAIALHNQKPPLLVCAPRFQAIFCIDEREESIRRHIEEVAPDAVTFGTAGFFSIAMYYRGAGDAHFVALCPAVVRPGHYVVEQVIAPLEDEHRRRARRRRVFGMATHRFHAESRSIGVGTILTAFVGMLASIPLVARTLFPRLTAQFRRRVVWFAEPPLTRLQLERADPNPRPDFGHQGFTIDEMADIGEKVLREIGLTSGLARLVLVIGHGSTSMNNPHESAHDCGACGGARGGPNARALAQILNDRRVRALLAGRGLVVPDSAVFVGGIHNTSNESVTFYDVDLVPDSHRQEFERARSDIEEACDRDAHERCRRFHSAPLSSSLSAARQHVEGRAEDLAQVRPEWGHATNAINVVGRRELSRGLFLDRRAFLTSYDPEQDDPEGTILTRILQAVFPVCAGISLEYYFSYVDNKGWGCGTKLPHNIVSLVGVMDGASSDLRTGLPWQMVEIHEPVRILFVVETTKETMLGILARNPNIERLCRNHWVSLAVIDPTTRKLSVVASGAARSYEPQAAVLPQAVNSGDWYRGWRDHLEFAEIAAAVPRHQSQGGKAG
jgi:uncharacterized protein YbcC (UPF0753/DUF2309 family)